MKKLLTICLVISFVSTASANPASIALALDHSQNLLIINDWSGKGNLGTTALPIVSDKFSSHGWNETAYKPCWTKPECSTTSNRAISITNNLTNWQNPHVADIEKMQHRYKILDSNYDTSLISEDKNTNLIGPEETWVFATQDYIQR
jgi:hypothetical protein